MSKFVRRLMIGLVLCLAPLALGRAADQPRIWLTPMHPHDDKRGGRAGAEDYMALFAPGAPWQTVEKHVAVFKIYGDFVRHASDDDILRLANGLAARHIALAVESSVLGPTRWCEPGKTQTEYITPVMARLKKLGVTVGYLAMTGPLIDGHSFKKEFYCHLPMDKVAADAAHTVALIRQFFPDIVVGDIEPVGRGPEFVDWHDLDGWFEAWRKASGTPLAFLHIDVNWTLPWKEDLQHFAERARADHIPFGVILDGGAADLSDKAYSDDAAEHALEVTAMLGPLLDEVNFQSWQTYPRHALPESDPDSMTGEVMAFLRPATRLTTTGSLSAGTLQVHLVDSDGAPVPNAAIVAESGASAANPDLAPQSITGFVPAGATDARIVLRDQTECTCSNSPTDVSITGFRFTQQGGPPFAQDVSSWANSRPGVTSAFTFNGERGLRISAPAGQALALNGALFPVNPGAAFTLNFAWQVPPASDKAGLVALIFTGSDNKEFLRTYRMMSTTWRPTAELRTDMAGQAAAPKSSGGPGSARLRLRYDGDQGHRAAPPLEIEAR